MLHLLDSDTISKDRQRIMKCSPLLLLTCFLSIAQNTYSEGVGSDKSYDIKQTEISESEPVELLFPSLYEFALFGVHEFQFQVGYKYTAGDGVTVDLDLAHGWLKESSSKGNLDAKSYLEIIKYLNKSTSNKQQKDDLITPLSPRKEGIMDYVLMAVSYDKEGPSGDYKKAASLYRKAASLGNPASQLRLGVLYAKGDGVLKDPKVALEWVQKAASQGTLQAQLLLGLWYAEGIETKKNLSKAKYWIQRADSSGSEHAAEIWNKFELWKF